MRSIHTKTFDSPFLVADTEQDQFYFPDQTDREDIIDTLERYCKFREFNRRKTYETIGYVLNNWCFRETRNIHNDLINAAMGSIELDC